MKRTKLLRNAPALQPLADDELNAVSGGRASVSDLSITKCVDRASSKLFNACCSGRHYDSAPLVLR
jgi:type VI protein secretion system component Hcp